MAMAAGSTWLKARGGTNLGLKVRVSRMKSEEKGIFVLLRIVERPKLIRFTSMQVCRTAPVGASARGITI
jgi:hypothetical protein